MSNPRVLIFGSPGDGGSGARALCQKLQRTKVAGLVSTTPVGGIYRIAKEQNVPFYYLPREKCTTEGYQEVAAAANADWYHLCGWSMMVYGLDSTITSNKHPALLPGYGGPGWHGIKVHRAVKADGRRITGFTIHFIDEQPVYDRGHTIYQAKVSLDGTETPEDIQELVKVAEQRDEAGVVDMLANREIWLVNGQVHVPEGYTSHHPIAYF